MKKTRAIMLAGGFLAVFLVAGCPNPTTSSEASFQGQAQDIGTERFEEDSPYKPFPITIQVGGGGVSRSIAGASEDRLRTLGIETYNYAQVIAMDSGGQVVFFGAYRVPNSTVKSMTYRIEDLNEDASYTFLILMGHWQRDYTEESDPSTEFVYVEEAPTLLAVGYEKIKPVSDIKINMFPLIVDTAFTTTNPVVTDKGFAERQPPVASYRPGEVVLLPVDWTVRWILSGTGLINLLKAQEDASGSGISLEAIASSGTITRDTDSSLPVSSPVTAIGGKTKTTITASLGSSVLGKTGIELIGTEASVNFRLDYVPLGSAYNDLDKWPDTGAIPKWVIRNGINDEPQNADTVFDTISVWDGTTSNGNGAVRFSIAGVTNGDSEDPHFPNYAEGETLAFSDEKYKGNSVISFNTEGYEDSATVRYVRTSSSEEPDLSEFTNILGDYESGGGPYEETIDPPLEEEYLWLVLEKDWMFSEVVSFNIVATDIELDFTQDDPNIITSQP
jgi:hypothetical protein